MEAEQHPVVVLDFGTHYSKLIARCVRENHVFSLIVPYGIPLDALRRLTPAALIFSDGSANVLASDAPLPDPGVFELGVPILGIGYGAQLLAHMLGGEVRCSERRESGIEHLTPSGAGPLFESVEPGTPVWMSQGGDVAALPPGFEVLGATESCPNAAIADPKRRFYGVQFRPEEAQTPKGNVIFANFLHGACGLTARWTMDSFIVAETERIRAQAGKRHVLCALSGGVDSSVAAVLIHRALGEQLTCVFVNNGLMRKGEPELVQRVFRDNFHIDLRYVDAADRFLTALAGVSDPEQKRKIIGKLFIDVFEEEARAIGDVEILAQGTLYPDVIESVSIGGGSAVTVKSHHNVGGLPEKMSLELLEPLRELFKDEVRVLGRALGLPGEIVDRHPFPGPGLGVRCVGAVTRERLDALREADAIFIDEIKQAGLYHDIWQALVCLLPVRSVGVRGDERSYEEACSLRAVISEDAMIADWFRFPPDVLERTASRICSEVPRINRVLYDVTSKPPGTIEWE
ncbi:MAG: glutamine-hydrolyzing GMP synthase [Candidatus Hydrogenedentales bacterium]|jgi:GMP synthase (glutamine-hydrolysing)